MGQVRRIIRSALSLVLMVSGAVAIALGLIIVVMAVLSLSWPSTPGNIVSSKITVLHGKGVSYRPEVVYKYLVGGNKFEGTSFWMFDDNVGRSRAYELMEEFPPGARITVYYDPISPNRAVLKPGVNAFTFVVGAIGCVAFVLGALLFPKRKNAETDQPTLRPQEI